MKKGLMTRKKAYAFVISGVLLALAAGVAYGAIPSSNGVISACKAKDGAIKLIDKEAGQNCPGSQQLVEWNKQGPAGQAGLSGYEWAANNTQSTSDDVKSIEAKCPTGKKVAGGGGSVIGDFVGTPAPPEVAIFYTGPSGTSSWEVKAHEVVPTNADWLLIVTAICVNAP
jgi:hypothetical protein